MRTISISLSVLLVAAVLVNPATTSAQAGLREGVKVRVSVPGAPRATGTIQRLTPDSIVLFAEPNGSRIGIARSTIQSLQVSQGRSASAGAKKGALWGAGIFGGIGVLIAVQLASDNFPSDPDQFSPKAVAAIAIAEGAGIGAIIGGFVKSEKWETVSVQPAVSMSSNGLRVGFNIR